MCFKLSLKWTFLLCGECSPVKIRSCSHLMHFSFFCGELPDEEIDDSWPMCVGFHSWTFPNPPTANINEVNSSGCTYLFTPDFITCEVKKLKSICKYSLDAHCLHFCYLWLEDEMGFFFQMTMLEEQNAFWPMQFLCHRCQPKT